MREFKYGVNNVSVNKEGSLVATGDTDGKALVFKMSKTGYEVLVECLLCCKVLEFCSVLETWPGCSGFAISFQLKLFRLLN